MRVSSCAIQILTGFPLPGAQTGRLIGAGVPRLQVAIIYDVRLSTLCRKEQSAADGSIPQYPKISLSATRCKRC